MFWLFLPSISNSVSAIRTADDGGPLQGGGRLVNEIMSTLPRPCCPALFFNDVSLEDNAVLKEVDPTDGLQVLNLRKTENDLRNSTNLHLMKTFGLGRQFRRTSWNTLVVVASEDPEVLKTFATYALNNRLLVWSSRVIIVTSLTPHDLRQLLSSHWTFSMMNVIVLNSEEEGIARWAVYTHLPYTPVGPQVVRLAVWSGSGRLLYTSHLRFFSEKFKNFHSGTLNVTKLDIVPMWFPVMQRSPDGSQEKKIIGNDYFLLEAVAKTLNFTFRELPVASWSEGFEKVANREAFLTPVLCAVLDTRLELFDFTKSYTYVRISFAMAKPTITPNWLSLYSPLDSYVWLSILITTLLMPPVYVLVTRSEVQHAPDTQRSIGWNVLMVVGVLIGQPQSGRLPKYNASRLAILMWFIFTFVISTGYQGNLTAHLTLPRYPSRAETVEELVNQADRVTVPPWGTDFKRSFKKSGAPVLERLADLMYIGPQIKEGLEEALTTRQAHLGGIVVMTIGIEKHFTHRDGTPKFYIGKETVIPGRAAWPIPHDAPFTDNFNWCLQACIEAGLYTKWTEDMLIFLRYENLRKKREESEIQQTTGNTDEEDIANEGERNENRPLTLQHMQGTFGLYAIGIITAIWTFIAEMCLKKSSGNI